MKERSGGSWTCNQCGKGYARSDTLFRHQKSHNNFTEERGELHRVTSGTFRACNQCAAARSRCSGGHPCGRCSLRGLSCLYPAKKNKTEQTAVASRGQAAEHTAQSSEDRHDPSSILANPSSELLPQAPTNEVLVHEQALHLRSEDISRQHHLSPVEPFAQPSLTDAVGNDFGFGTTTFDDPPFDQQVNLNWIPVFPTPYDAELEQDFSFLFPPLGNASAPVLEFDGNLTTNANFFQTLRPPNAPTAMNDDVSTRPPISSPRSAFAFSYSPTSSTSNDQVAIKSTTSSAGAAGRKRKRRKSSFIQNSFARSSTSTNAFYFPLTTNEWSASHSFCSDACYGAIIASFQQFSLLNEFDTSNPPSQQQMDYFVSLYFKHFQPNLPLLHEPTFGKGTDWLVVLAVASIGASFSNDIDMQEALTEMLRRAVLLRQGMNLPGTLGLTFAQASILNLVGLTMSHREQLRGFAPQCHAELSRWCLHSGILQLPMNDQVDDSWEHWIEVESLRRAAYIAWLLDVSLGYMANTRPSCNLDDARTPLPCSEELWGAKDADEWRRKTRDNPPSLCVALEQLYSKKAADPNLSDLSHVLLINALIQRTQEVGTHIRQPLAELRSSGAAGFLTTPSKDSFWLPLYPLYATWRNSACDCLDMIQWHAASTVAKSAGTEHDLMLHLHLARIVLLTPFQEIQDLLFSLIGRVKDDVQASFYVHDGSFQPRNRTKLPQTRKIMWRWLKDDQYKARLAVIHCGNVFWHVRRYSSQSFYEPLAVYLASLVLWTYGSYKSAAFERENKKEGGPSGPNADLSIVQPSRAEREVRHRPDGMNDSPGTDQDSSSDSSSQEQPEFIHLDRPNDEEMIAHFVRSGEKMSGFVSNVGDVCKTPQKVLVEGAKLLRTRLSCWGVSREYHEVLTQLSELRRASETDE